MKSVFSVCLFFLLSTAIPAAAHKVVISIYAGSGEIEGEIGYANGHMAPGVRVTVTDATGNPLGETRTDAEGRFTFVPAQAVEHVFRADPGAGHVAETRMSAHEIPLPDAPMPTIYVSSFINVSPLCGRCGVARWRTEFAVPSLVGRSAL